MELHHGLADAGIEVRTLALAPGRGRLPSLPIPAMSPSPRSLAAHTQLRREQRWADVVVLRGARVAAASGLVHVRSAPPSVLHLTDEVVGWEHGRVPARVRRSLRSGPGLVVTHEEARSFAAVLGVDPTDVAVIPDGVAVSRSHDADRRRRQAAARAVLGLDVAALVVLVDGHGTAADDAGREVERLGAVAVAVSEPGNRRGPAVEVRFGARPVLDDAPGLDVLTAAADLVVAPGAGTAGPPLRLLRAAADGVAVVAAGSGAVGGLVDDSTGWPTLVAAVAAGRPEIERRGHAAARRVAERYDLATVTERWIALLRSARRRGMSPTGATHGP